MSLVFPLLAQGAQIARIDFAGVLVGSCYLTKEFVENHPLVHSKRFERAHALSIDTNAKHVLVGLATGPSGYAQIAPNGLSVDAFQVDSDNLEPGLEALAAQGKSYEMTHVVPISYAATQQVHIKSYVTQTTFVCVAQRLMNLP